MMDKNNIIGIAGNMDRQILLDYIDACELLKETEAEIRKLNKKKKTMVQENVKGSNPDFPYQEQHFKVEGTPYNFQDDTALRHEEKLLEERKANAERIKSQVERWMQTMPMRVQRIIRMKYFERLQWEEIAVRMGRGATADSVRKEMERFF